MSDIDLQFQRIGASDAGRPRKTILILGAGMSGLVCGYELKRLGHTVRILEGSGRVGGRVHTRRFADGTHGELGAMRIPINHHYTRHYVSEMKLTLRKFITSHENLECFYDIAGTVCRMKDAPQALYPKFDLSRDQRKAPVAPAFFGEAMDQLVRSLTDRERLQLFASAGSSARVAAVDTQSLRGFLYERIGRDAAELVGLTTGLDSLFDRGITMFLRDSVSDEGAGLDEITEGMDALPTRLSESLKDNIEFGVAIEGIRVDDAGTVHLQGHRGGATFEFSTQDPVVCTLPFTVLRSLPNGMGVSRAKARVIRQLGYTSSTKVLLHASRRFWETDYGIYGGASQTDSPIRSMYYPSDFVSVVREPTPLAQFRSLYTGHVGGEFASTVHEARGGVLLGSYTWGAEARRMGALSPDQRRALVTSAIARYHPEVEKEGVIDDHASMFWDESPWMRGGTFSFLEPTQQFDLVAEASRREGALRFAGEHCSLENAWIQGAARSALDVVEEIVAN